MFGIVTAYFNPWNCPVMENQLRCFIDWAKCQSVPICVVVLKPVHGSFVREQRQGNVVVLERLGDPMVWQKELLLNIGATHLLTLIHHLTHVCWFDIDTYPTDRDWKRKIEKTLELDVFQVPDLIVARGQRRRSLSMRGTAHGYAWGLSREIWLNCGMFIWDYLGGGDTSLACAVGLRPESWFSGQNSILRLRRGNWIDYFHKHLRTPVGCARVQMMSLSHGGDRDYTERIKLYEELDINMIERIQDHGLIVRDSETKEKLYAYRQAPI